MALNPRAYLAEFIATFALVLAVMVSATMHISGGHVNPAVTIGQLVTGKIDPTNGILYIISQLIGGIVGGSRAAVAFPGALSPAGPRIVSPRKEPNGRRHQMLARPGGPSSEEY